MVLSAGESAGTAPLYTFDSSLARVEGVDLLPCYAAPSESNI